MNEISKNSLHSFLIYNFQWWFLYIAVTSKEIEFLPQPVFLDL